MAENERRSGDKPRSSGLRGRLTDDQKLELATLERFGAWWLGRAGHYAPLGAANDLIDFPLATVRKAAAITRAGTTTAPATPGCVCNADAAAW